MLRALDIEIEERSGSRVVLKKGAIKLVVHRPHPRPVVGRPAVRTIREFIRSCGVKP